jgi:hypothetical protein
MKLSRILPGPGWACNLLLVAVLTLAANTVQAQNYFEGTLVFKGYELENGKMQESGTFTMVCNKDRMRIYSDGDKASSEMLPGVESDQILIRHDKQDFVIFTGSNEALGITKSDIEGLFGMLKAFMGETPETQAQTEPGGELIRTGQSETFNGNKASQWVYSTENGEEVHLWLSETIQINWGMFKEPWFSSVSNDFSGPFSRVINEGYLPLKVETYKDGELTMVFKTDEVKQQRIPNSDLDIPAGTSVKTLQQIMMEQFQGRN